jgi:methionyl-tRNA formyltransferase
MLPADLFSDPAARFCLAGKNDIAVGCLEHLLASGVGREKICVVLNKDDTGRSTWQHSLGFHARRLGVRACLLDEVKDVKDLWFFSVEFDQILRPAQFSSRRLFNVHFSKLPAYRGVATSVWPILRGEKETGVTFHRIDEGVDTGAMLLQRTFPIGEEWTARDLYFRYLEEGLVLFREAIALLRGGEVREVPQDESLATLFRRRDLDFKNLAIDTSLCAARACAQIRAYAFWEYQLPIINGRKIWSARRRPGPATNSAGAMRLLDATRALLSLSDGDLELHLSPYDQLYDWASGLTDEQPALASVPDLDLQDAQGWSAMMKAAHSGNVEAIRGLADAGASSLKANRRGTTPLMYAFTRMVERDDPAAFSALLDLGADPFASDQHGRTINDYLPPSSRLRYRSAFPHIFR